MYLFIEPVDVWLFRDGRSFDAQSDHRAASLFPPYPTVTQGVIRSHQLVLQGVELWNKEAIEKVVGTTTDYGKLRVRGPFLAKREGNKLVRYFPQPADAVTVDKETRQIKALAPKEIPNGVMCSAPTPMLLWDDEPKKGVGGLWLSEEQLRAYVVGDTVVGIPSSRLFWRENRFGIGLERETGTTREGMLYEVEYVRPRPDVGLVVEVNGYAGWPDTGLLRMGGEGRGGRFTQYDDLKWPKADDPLPERFKIYFATPTYFNEGWQPSDWGRFFEGQVTLQAAALRRYESVGGFDMTAKGVKRHKSALRYVPAGSVYYFKCKGSARLRADLIQNAITDLGAEIGFGQVIIGRWEK